jgi:hypothetical protein
MTHKTKIFFILILAIGLNRQAFSQESNYILLKGTVVDNMFEPIPYVSVMSKSTRRGTISRDNGEFTVRIASNDTLLFSALSYQKKETPVNQLNILGQYIILEKNIYLLGEINVMELRWQEFQNKIMNTEVKREDQTKVQVEGLLNIFQPRIELSPYAGNTNPLSLALTYFKKENIRKRKQKRWRKIAKKGWIEKK